MEKLKGHRSLETATSVVNSKGTASFLTQRIEADPRKLPTKNNPAFSKTDVCRVEDMLKTP